MLPAAARVRTRRDHRLVATTARRVRRGAVVVALATTDSVADRGLPARAGVIVGRRVGAAVVRNRVKRRLREILRSRLPELPNGSLVVVRALPGAADASFAELAGWVDAGLRRFGPTGRGAASSHRHLPVTL